MSKFFVFVLLVFAFVFLIKYFLLPGAVGGEYSCVGCNVVLISVDTLRADHVGFYGYWRNTTPFIDGFAGNAVVFDNAYSTAPKTTESHMSVFTSLYPSVHMVHMVDWGLRDIRRLDNGIVTLTQILRDHGYATGGFFDNPNVGPELGFDKGFDFYNWTSPNAINGWIQKNHDKKFFLFVHTNKPHSPYLPNPPYDTLFDPDYSGGIISKKSKINISEWGTLSNAFWSSVNTQDPRDLYHLQALYDGNIREADMLVGDVLEAVLTMAPNTLVVFMADHGEEFKEHGGFDHWQMYNELLQVPLFILNPRGSGSSRVETRVSLIDLSPTILDILSINSPAQFQGESLMPVVSGARKPEYMLSEYNIRQGDLSGWRMSLILNDTKLVLTPNKKEVYDLALDSLECEGNNISLNQSEFNRMYAKLARINASNQMLMESLNRGESNLFSGLGQESVRRLKELGYLS